MSDRRDEEIARGLRELGPALDAWTVEEPAPELTASTLLRARGELSRPPSLAAADAGAPRHLPVGFKRELLRLVTATLPALVLVLAWNLLVLTRAPDVLGALLGEPLALALVGAYVVGATGWLALTYGTLPMLAHRRARLRLLEVT
jgi:hypothetical protein